MTATPAPEPPGRAPGGSVAGNAAWLLAADLVSKVASFVLVVVLARALGIRQYGYVTFALAFVPLFLQLARWGIDNATVQRIAADPAALSEVVVNGLVARAGLAVAGTAAAVVLSPLLVQGRSARLAVAVLAAALLIDEITTFLAGVFQAFERMRFNAMLLLVNRGLSMVLVVAVVGLGGGLVWACLAYLLGSVGALASGWVALARCFPPVDHRALRGPVVRGLLGQGAPYGLASFLDTAVFRVDAVLLQALRGPAAVGMYGVAYRFFEPLLFAAWGVGAAVLPRLVRERRQPGGSATFELALAALLAFYLPVAVVAPVTARWLVTGLFSARYAPATPAVVWLAAAACLYTVAHLARTASIAAGRRGVLVGVAAAALAINVVANLVVVPAHGFVGAAAVTLATEALEAALLVGLYVRGGGRVGAGGPVLVPVLAAATLAATLAATGWRDGQAVLLAPPVYAAALVLAARLVLGPDARGALSRLRPSAGEVLASAGALAHEDGDGAAGGAVAVGLPLPAPRAQGRRWARAGARSPRR